MMIIHVVGAMVTGKAIPRRTDPTQIAEARIYAVMVLSFFLVMRKPRSGEQSVMKITEVEAMPPMRPITTPSRRTVLRKVSPSLTPILASGQSEVSEIEVALRKEDVTRTIMTRVKAMNSRNPELPRVLRATSAIDLPPSRMLMKSVV